VTIAWDFGDGSEGALNVTAGGTIVHMVSQSHGYTSAGQYVIRARVTDGRSDEVVVTRTLNVSSMNMPPTAQISFQHEGEMLLPNQSLTMTVTITDSERDPIEAYVDFGDGSPRVYLNLTEFLNNSVSFALNHSYSKVGTYVVTLWYTDNTIGALEHNKTSVRYVEVEMPEEEVAVVWDWWDYTSLGLFCSFPFAVIAWGLYVHHRHRMLERKGISYDEWRLRRDELADKLMEEKE
jgi:PKD repeat protein